MEVNYPSGKKKNKYSGGPIKSNGGSIISACLTGINHLIDSFNDGYDADTYNLLNYNFNQLKIIS